jgi:hypothetical protein
MCDELNVCSGALIEIILLKSRTEKHFDFCESRFISTESMTSIVSSSLSFGKSLTMQQFLVLRSINCGSVEVIISSVKAL